MYEKRITLKDTCPVCGATITDFEYNVKGQDITFLKIDCIKCHTRFSYKPDPIPYNAFMGTGSPYTYDPEKEWNNNGES